MRRIPQFADKLRTVVLAALLAGPPLLAHDPASADRVSSGRVIALIAAAPASARATNQAMFNTVRSNVPAATRSPARTKAGVLAAGGLIALTILMVACGLALLSSFKKR